MRNDMPNAPAADLTREQHREIGRLENALLAAWRECERLNTPAAARAVEEAQDACNFYKGGLEVCYQPYCLRSTADTGRAYCVVHDVNQPDYGDES